MGLLPPEVSITLPYSGQELAGSELFLWSCSETGNDENLSFSISYSTNGVSFVTLLERLRRFGNRGVDGEVQGVQRAENEQSAASRVGDHFVLDVPGTPPTQQAGGRVER